MRQDYLQIKQATVITRTQNKSLRQFQAQTTEGAKRKKKLKKKKNNYEQKQHQKLRTCTVQEENSSCSRIQQQHASQKTSNHKEV